MRFALSGQGASRGLALGRARVRLPQSLEIAEEIIPHEQVEDELARLNVALDVARDELKGLRERLHGALAHELGDFLDIHALILDDPELLHGLDALILTGHYSAEYALKLQRDRLVSVFDGMADPYFKSRREDIDHVISRVRVALHRNPDEMHAGLAGEIMVSDTIAPSELAQLQAQGVLAIVTSTGSTLSHSAILARSLHLPMVIGAHDALTHINDGDALMVDGTTGGVIREPSATDLRHYGQRQRALQREQKNLNRLRQAETRTLDGVDIDLYANAESRVDVAEAHSLGACGIGLYRTEFLFLQRRELPDEHEQFRVYRDLVLGMNGRPVTIRTLDLGADKAHGSGLTLIEEPNPALGLRGVRLSLAHRPLFETQLRAILRASGYGPVRILIPMISRREEILEVRSMVKSLTSNLREAGHEVGKSVDLGAMIEVPSAALALTAFIKQVEFISIGTNDLVQYLLAADRSNDALGELASPLHPAVLRLLHELIATGREHGIPVAVCGEMAGDVRYTRLLLALGLTDFSLHPSTLLEVRRVIRETDLRGLRRRLRRLLKSNDRASIEHWLAHGLG